MMMNIFHPGDTCEETPLLTLLCMILAGCDNPKSLESLRRKFTSFRTNLIFDPLRGPAKDFSQTLMSENGEVAKQVTGTLSQEGCL